jgi:hypothetical protein
LTIDFFTVVFGFLIALDIIMEQPVDAPDAGAATAPSPGPGPGPGPRSETANVSASVSTSS